MSTLALLVQWRRSPGTVALPWLNPLAPLPSDVLDVLKVANGDEAATTTAAAACGKDGAELRSSALKFVREVLHASDATYYRRLGVEVDAPIERIREHYRELISVFHPDRMGAESLPGDSDIGAAINEAYNTLKHPESRAKYDRVRTGRPIEVRPAQPGRDATATETANAAEPAKRARPSWRRDEAPNLFVQWALRQSPRTMKALAFSSLLAIVLTAAWFATIRETTNLTIERRDDVHAAADPMDVATDRNPAPRTVAGPRRFDTTVGSGSAFPTTTPNEPRLNLSSKAASADDPGRRTALTAAPPMPTAIPSQVTTPASDVNLDPTATGASRTKGARSLASAYSPNQDLTQEKVDAPQERAPIANSSTPGAIARHPGIGVITSMQADDLGTQRTIQSNPERQVARGPQSNVTAAALTFETVAAPSKMQVTEGRPQSPLSAPAGIPSTPRDQVAVDETRIAAAGRPIPVADAQMSAATTPAGAREVDFLVARLAQAYNSGEVAAVSALVDPDVASTDRITLMLASYRRVFRDTSARKIQIKIDRVQTDRDITTVDLSSKSIITDIAGATQLVDGNMTIVARSRGGVALIRDIQYRDLPSAH
jgi:hypothetical protein